MAYLITVGLPTLFLAVFTTGEDSKSLDPTVWFRAASWFLRNETSIVVVLCVAASAFVYLYLWPHTAQSKSVRPASRVSEP